MEKPLQKIFQFLYGPFFSVIDFFLCSYKANRLRLTQLTSHKNISIVIQSSFVVILIVWIAVFFSSSDESKGRLTQAVKDGVQSLELLQKND